MMRTAWIPVVLVLTAAAACAPAMAKETPAQDLHQAQKLNEEAYGYLTTGRYVEAAALYKKILELKPMNTAFIYHCLGIAYYHLNNPEQALKFYDLALKERPLYATALVNRALAYEKLGRNGEALEDYERALDLEPGSDDLRARLAMLYAAMQRPEEAEREFLKALEINPDNGSAHAEYARLLAQRGDAAGAWKHVHAAQDLDIEVDGEFVAELRGKMPEPHHDPAPAGPVVDAEDMKALQKQHPYPKKNAKGEFISD